MPEGRRDLCERAVAGVDDQHNSMRISLDELYGVEHMRTWFLK